MGVVVLEKVVGLYVVLPKVVVEYSVVVLLTANVDVEFRLMVELAERVVDFVFVGRYHFFVIIFTGFLSFGCLVFNVVTLTSDSFFEVFEFSKLPNKTKIGVQAAIDNNKHSKIKIIMIFFWSRVSLSLTHIATVRIL